jgi:hypothetical protein
MVACGIPNISAITTPVCPQAEIVGLQPRQDQVGLLRGNRRGEEAGHAERVEFCQIVGFDVDRTVSALGQRFPNGLPGTLRSGAEHNHFAAVLFLEQQGRFQRVRVRLIDLKAEILFRKPLAARINVDAGIPHGNLLHRHYDFHREFSAGAARRRIAKSLNPRADFPLA